MARGDNEHVLLVAQGLSSERRIGFPFSNAFQSLNLPPRSNRMEVRITVHASQTHSNSLLTESADAENWTYADGLAEESSRVKSVCSTLNSV